MPTRARPLLTFRDAVDHLAYFLNANPSESAYRDARRAVLSAMDELASLHNWSYYTRTLRINTKAPYSTGTIAYDHTGGSVSGTNYERLVTLSGDGAEFPTWAPYGTLLIGDVAYDVSGYINSTHIQLDSASNPGEDVAASTSYVLYRDTYVLPSDLSTIDELMGENTHLPLDYCHPREWLRGHRGNQSSASPPTRYTIMGARDYMGVMCVRFFPYPSAAETLDAIYRARPRPLLYENYQTGTVTCTAAASSLTGSGTSWSSEMIGSVIRLSADNNDYPTGRTGGNPADQERIVVSVSSTTSLTVDRNWDTTRSSGVKYRISDPIDIELGSMTTVFLRLCEQQVSAIRRLEDAKEIAARAADALERAMQADSRVTAPRSVYDMRWKQRLADMPSADDEE